MRNHDAYLAAGIAMHRLVRGVCVFAAMALITASPLRAQENPVPMDVQYPLLLKVLYFDRNLKSRAGEKITICVLYQREYHASVIAKNEFIDAAQQSVVRKVQGLDVEIVPLDIGDGSGLSKALAASHASVLYIAPLRAVDVRAVSSYARKNRVLSTTGVPKYMTSGVTVSIGMKNDKPEILINPQAARAEDADFNSQLLMIAHIIS